MPTTPRRAALAALVALTGGGALAGPAHAAEPASFKCVRAGDRCFSAFRLDGRQYLQVATAKRVYRTYRVCLRAPTGQLDCRRLTLRRAGRTYLARVRWSASFPNRGRGTYRWSTPAGQVTFVV